MPAPLGLPMPRLSSLVAWPKSAVVTFFIVKSSIFKRLPSELIFLISNLAFVKSIKKETFFRVFPAVFCLEPVLCHVPPLLVEYHSSHSVSTSVPYTPWETMTSRTPVTSKTILKAPESLILTAFVPFFASLALLPTKASTSVQFPLLNSSVLSAYVFFEPFSKSSGKPVATLAVRIG